MRLACGILLKLFSYFVYFCLVEMVLFTIVFLQNEYDDDMIKTDNERVYKFVIHLIMNLYWGIIANKFANFKEEHDKQIEKSN